MLDKFKAKGMKAVREKLTVHNMPDEDRKRYKRFLDNLHTEASIAQTVMIEQEEKIKEEREKGEKEGEEKGRKNRELEIATQMIKMNLANDQIIKITGLSKEEIEQLHKEITKEKH